MNIGFKFIIFCIQQRKILQLVRNDLRNATPQQNDRTVIATIQLIEVDFLSADGGGTRATPGLTNIRAAFCHFNIECVL